MNQSPSPAVRVYEPGGMKRHFWGDLWNYRELFLVLAWRDVSVRYKQTLIGVLWVLMRPVITMVVFTLIFQRLGGLPGEAGVPYALLVFAGALSWNFFSSAITEASNSLLSNSHLITKVYFPLAIIPASCVFVAMVDYSVSILILPVLMLWFTFLPGWQLALLPVFAFLTAALALGLGLLLASLTVKFRDFRHIVSLALQFGVLISPVGYTSSLVPERWRAIYSLNPLVGVIDGSRWCIASGKLPFPWESVTIACVVIALLMGLGFTLFRNNEKTLTDVI